MIAFYLALIDEPSDKEKFKEIYYKHKKLMRDLAMSIVKDEMTAEDIVQDSFLKIAKNICKFSDVDCNKSVYFIVIIVRNTAFDYLRKEKHIDSVPYNDNIKTTDRILMPDYERAISNSGMGYVMDAISEMDKNYSDVLKLKYIYGYTVQEMADFLNISEQNVNVRVHRARKILKEKLEEYGYAIK